MHEKNYITDNYLAIEQRVHQKIILNMILQKRGNRLFQNLVDAENPTYIPKNIIDGGLTFHTRETFYKS